MAPKDDDLPRRLERTTLYESPWVTLHRDRVMMPNGHLIEQYHVIDLGHGAVAVLVENSEGEILLERVARYPTQNVSWELPAGGLEANETATEAAEREVTEETGYETTDHRLIYTYHPLNGVSGMTVYLVHCIVGARTGSIDTNGIEGTRWFSPLELESAVREGAITDGLALIGILLHLRR